MYDTYGDEGLKYGECATELDDAFKPTRKPCDASVQGWAFITRDFILLSRSISSWTWVWVSILSRHNKPPRNCIFAIFYFIIRLVFSIIHFSFIAAFPSPRDKHSLPRPQKDDTAHVHKHVHKRARSQLVDHFVKDIWGTARSPKKGRIDILNF